MTEATTTLTRAEDGAVVGDLGADEALRVRIRVCVEHLVRQPGIDFRPQDVVDPLDRIALMRRIRGNGHHVEAQQGRR